MASALLNCCSKENVGEETKLTSNSAEQKESWGNKREFILASIGLAVGLGNVWRFPYLCQKNGGGIYMRCIRILATMSQPLSFPSKGAFLIPYVIVMVLEGFPLFIIEYAIGQRFKKSAIGCWTKIHPALRGVGIASVILSLLLCLYYIAVIAWSFYYMFVSFTTTLPWDRNQCPNNLPTLNATNNLTCCTKDPESFYFYEKALGVSSSVQSTDGKPLPWKMTLCLLLSWLLVYVCVVKGVKSSGKVVYFTATFPYVILIILLIVGATLSGADIGLVAFFKPDFSKLLEPKIWLDAAGQMFYSLSLGFGALLAFASYMPTKNNCMKDAYTVVGINCGTSVLAGIVVFSILGHREQETGQSAIESGSGPGLVFITFANAFLQMDGGPVWAVLFFFMLILLGIDSEFGTFESLVYPFYDLNLVSMRKELFSGLVAAVLCLIGLSLVSPVGYYVFQIFDDYALSIGLLTVGFFQTVAVAWVYGNDKFANDIEFMTGKRPSLLWLMCWKYISPIVILIIIIANVYVMTTSPLHYKAYVGCETIHNDTVIIKPYPGWAKFIISLLILLPIVPIFVYLLKDLIQNPKSWKEGFKDRLCHAIEYMPDPSAFDLNRRYTVADFYEQNSSTLTNEKEVKEEESPA